LRGACSTGCSNSEKSPSTRSADRAPARSTPKLRRLRIGRISAQDEFAGLADESAENLGWAFLQRLRDGGRGAVEAWLDEAAPRASRAAAEGTAAA
jgi:hypothetical protein